MSEELELTDELYVLLRIRSLMDRLLEEEQARIVKAIPTDERVNVMLIAFALVMVPITFIMVGIEVGLHACH